MTPIVVYEQICHFASGAPPEGSAPALWDCHWSLICSLIDLKLWMRVHIYDPMVPYDQISPFRPSAAPTRGSTLTFILPLLTYLQPDWSELCLRVHVSDVNVLHGRISRFRSSGPFWGWGPCTFGFILPLHSSDLKLLMRVHINDFISSKLTNFSILAKGHLQGVGPVALLDYCCSFIF